MSISEEKLSKVTEDAIALLHKFVVPLYGSDRRGRPAQVGSGFFVKFQSKCFLVSAAHVLRELPEMDLFYYIKPNVTRKVVGQRILGRVPEGHIDQLDVGGVLLSRESLPPYPAVDKFAVDTSYLRPQYLPRTGKQYVIVGFPASRSKLNPVAKTVTTSPHAYYSGVTSEETYAMLGLSTETHLVLPLDLKKGFDSSGRHRNPPKPQGMSGSPVWVLYEENVRGASRTFPLVAVGTTYKKNLKVLIATDIAVVVDLINSTT